VRLGVWVGAGVERARVGVERERVWVGVGIRRVWESGGCGSWRMSGCG